MKPKTPERQQDLKELLEAKDNLCLDCGVDTMDLPFKLDAEVYMVHDALWAQAVPEHAGMLCIGCLENRLGRQLTPEDFADVPINKIRFQSGRLRNRLGVHQ